jgi:AraC-like DNA-binding protein
LEKFRIRALLGSMIVKTFAPGPELAPFVRVFEIVETAADESLQRTVFPDVGLVAGFRYAGCATLMNGKPPQQVLPNAAITGLRTRVREMHTSPNGGIVLTKFRAAGAAPFFETALHELFGRMTALDALIEPDLVARTSSQINAATTDEERIGIVQQFWLARLHSASPDPLVSGALRAICAAAGAIRVGPLALALGVSQDTLEKRFRRIVGATPRQFASIVRLRRAVDLSREQTTLTALAQDAGYYDQSHFIRDFRASTGDAPGRFFVNVTYC